MITRRSPLSLGLIAFVATFALIVSMSLLGLGAMRVINAMGEPSPSPSPSPSTSSSSSPTPSTTPIPGFKGDYCYRHPAENSRPSKDVAAYGHIAGGGITTKVHPPFTADSAMRAAHLAFTTDSVMVSSDAEKNWASNVSVGQVKWQPGVEYPGNEKAADRIFDCVVNNSTLWEPRVSGRTLENRSSSPVTINGMAGHKVTGRLKFNSTTLEDTKYEDITVVVVDTDKGPAVHASLIADNSSHEYAAQKSLDELTKV